MKLEKSGHSSSGDWWQLVTNPWPYVRKWPAPGPYCRTRIAAVTLWFLQAALGCKIFWKLAFRLRTARYWVSYFFFGNRAALKRTQNSSYYFLDASLDAYVDKELGAVTFLCHVHGLSPMNVARLIQGIAENPEAKKNINRVLRQERAATQLV